jgi:hypothetical protein
VRKDRRIQNPFVEPIAKHLAGLGSPETVATEQVWTAVGEDIRTPYGTTERRPIPIERRARHCLAVGEAMAELGYTLKQDRSRGATRGTRFYERQVKPAEAEDPEFEDTL